MYIRWFDHKRTLNGQISKSELVHPELRVKLSSCGSLYIYNAFIVVKQSCGISLLEEAMQRKSKSELVHPELHVKLSSCGSLYIYNAFIVVKQSCGISLLEEAMQRKLLVHITRYM